ncbi:TetR/AcrR family transcriptional regulator [Paenibacillus sp. strain BS8-2]
MRKGQMTKEHIIRESSVLFNTKGYNAASLSDIMEKCGIRKGGIYNHFANKDEIAIAAFDYLFSQLLALLSDAMKAAVTSKEKLLAIGEVYIDIVENEALIGGCPLLNAAVEHDESQSMMRERTQQAVQYLINRLTEMIQQGVASQEFREDIVVEEAATSIVAIIEGGVMLSRLLEDRRYMRHCVHHMTQFIDDRLLARSQ